MTEVISEKTQCKICLVVFRTHSVFQGFSKAKSANGGSSQFLILPQLPQKIKIASKVVKIDSKIIIWLPKIKIPETHCSMQIKVSFVIIRLKEAGRVKFEFLIRVSKVSRAKKCVQHKI